MIRGGSAVGGEVAARRRAAAGWTLGAAALGVVVVLAGLAADRPGMVLAAAWALALQLLPALRAQAILRGRRHHFQPFLLLLLVVAAVVPLVVGAALLADGGPLPGAVLLLWAVVTGAAVGRVQRSHLLT